MDLDPLTPLFADGATPLLRTDFSDDAAWQRVATSLAGAAADVGGYAPNVRPVEDAAYSGATAVALAAAAGGRSHGYVLLADARTMREASAGGEVTVGYVDLSVDDEAAEEFGLEQGRDFRCEVGEVASIEANLSIANMDFEEFADNVEDDGVFRGFAR